MEMTTKVISLVSVGEWIDQMVEHSKYWGIVLGIVGLPQSTGLKILYKTIVYLYHDEGCTYFQKKRATASTILLDFQILLFFCLFSLRCGRKTLKGTVDS